jgi:hypothetical protein
MSSDLDIETDANGHLWAILAVRPWDISSSTREDHMVGYLPVYPNEEAAQQAAEQAGGRTILQLKRTE